MGSPPNEPGRDDDERQHAVTISRDFLLGATLVTQGQWKRVMNANPSELNECGADCPVENVTWRDAVSFCNRLSDAEGLSRCYSSDGDNVTWKRDCAGYRLPTEAEWEYAARAGATTEFANGPITASRNQCEDDPTLDEMGWYCANAGRRTHPVAQKKPNAWGLYDMHGLVWEPVWDWYEYDYTSREAADPVGPSSGPGRVIRAGSWSRLARSARSANRNYVAPDFANSSLGLRVARSLP